MTAPMRQAMQAWLVRRGLDLDAVWHTVSDTVVLEPPYTGPALPEGQPVYTGVWGITTQDVSYGTGSYQEFVGHPLAGMEDPGQLAAIPWPSPDWFDYASLHNTLESKDPRRNKARVLSVMSMGNPLEIYTWMTGMEETMMNLLTNPDLVRAALDRICSYFEEKLKRCAAALNGEVELVHMADDLGSQQGPLIAPELYRSVVQPFHRRLIDNARRCLSGVKVMHHSDGAVFDVLPDLIDAGIDLLEAVQTDAAGMDPRRLKDTYGQRIGFHGGISVQALLPRTDAQTVERECRQLAHIFGKGGGYIAAPSHAIQAGTPPENVWAMLEGILGDDLETLRQ